MCLSFLSLPPETSTQWCLWITSQNGPTKDQTALTIAKLFVEEVVSKHGVPSQLLSDRGQAFLSKLMGEVCEVLGVRKVNTTSYHPQTDGLVERFNRTLTNMLAS